MYSTSMSVYKLTIYNCTNTLDTHYNVMESCPPIRATYWHTVSGSIVNLACAVCKPCWENFLFDQPAKQHNTNSGKSNISKELWVIELSWDLLAQVPITSGQVYES